MMMVLLTTQGMGQTQTDRLTEMNSLIFLILFPFYLFIFFDFYFFMYYQKKINIQCETFK